MQLDKVVIKPIVTEQSTAREAEGKYTFMVMSRTNKVEVKKAVEKIFGTKVSDVNILNTQLKMKKRGKTVGRVMGYKKAIVTLKKGEKIRIREEQKSEDKKVKKQENKKAKEEKEKE